MVRIWKLLQKDVLMGGTWGVKAGSIKDDAKVCSLNTERMELLSTELGSLQKGQVLGSGNVLFEMPVSKNRAVE